jgi:hypothetical protein
VEIGRPRDICAVTAAQAQNFSLEAASAPGAFKADAIKGRLIIVPGPWRDILFEQCTDFSKSSGALLDDGPEHASCSPIGDSHQGRGGFRPDSLTLRGSAEHSSLATNNKTREAWENDRDHATERISDYKAVC